MPCAWRSFARRCSSTSCVRQYGHQSADRLNTSIAPLGPSTDASDRAAPAWSVAEKSGTRTPGLRPEAVDVDGRLCGSRAGRRQRQQRDDSQMPDDVGEGLKRRARRRVMPLSYRDGAATIDGATQP